jgi:hypothetical protein
VINQGNEMGEIYGSHGDEKFVQNFRHKIWRKETAWETQTYVGDMLLKLMLQKQVVRAWTRFQRQTLLCSGCSYEHGNEPSLSIRVGIFIDLMKRRFATCSDENFAITIWPLILKFIVYVGI